jgi:carboxylesterase
MSLLLRLRALKSRFVGDQMWSGPGGRGEPGVAAPIKDVSFHHAGGPEAVLLIHGLTGTPTEMRFIGKQLAAAGFTVYGMQLAGHCGSEDDLLQTTWHDWYASVEAAWAEIAKRHQTVFAAGLSMGAVLALMLAARRPGAVKGVALYSTTLWYDGWTIPKLQFLLPLFLYTPLGLRYRFVETWPYGIKDERLRARVVASMESGDSAAAGTLGMAGRSLRELRSLVRQLKRELPKVKTPALLLHARNDDVTSVKNADYVERHIGGPVRKVLLEDCYHMITVDRQRHEVARQSIEFFRALNTGPAALKNAAE